MAKRLVVRRVLRLEQVEPAAARERTASDFVPGLKHLPIRYRIRPAPGALR